MYLVSQDSVWSAHVIRENYYSGDGGKVAHLVNSSHPYFSIPIVFIHNFFAESRKSKRMVINDVFGGWVGRSMDFPTVHQSVIRRAQQITHDFENGYLHKQHTVKSYLENIWIVDCAASTSLLNACMNHTIANIHQVIDICCNWMSG